MRGEDDKHDGMFSYVSPEKRVPQDHPLRSIRKLVDPVLKEMSPRSARLYSKVGRLSIPPEPLLRAFLLQIFYSVAAADGTVGLQPAPSSGLGACRWTTWCGTMPSSARIAGGC